ncbi:unnamed protein product [Arctogadus glacialis]
MIAASSFLKNKLIMGFHVTFGVYLFPNTAYLCFLKQKSESILSSTPCYTMSYGFVMICGPRSGMLMVEYGARVVSMGLPHHHALCDMLLICPEHGSVPTSCWPWAAAACSAASLSDRSVTT